MVDSEGNLITDIVRTPTDITRFSGTMPYQQGEKELIQQWAQDNLMCNMFRITEIKKGGASPWNMDCYLNIWSGDLQINEPVFNVEELFLRL